MAEGQTGFQEEGEKRLNNGKLSCSPRPATQPPIQCPECASRRLYKDGLRYTSAGAIQRWLCRTCGYRFSQPKVKVNVSTQSLKRFNSEPDFFDADVTKRNFSVKERRDSLSFQRRKDVASHASSKGTIAEKVLNTFGDYNRECQVCETDGASKNLIKSETRLNQAAGATKTTSAEVKGKIVEFLFWMQKQGYAESTIVSRGSRLRRLAKLKADLFNPDSVKEVIATQANWSIARKDAMVWTYDLWVRWLGITWEKPNYKPVRKLPFIPLEREIDDLIAGCNKHVATFLQIAKETGARAGEIYSLKWIDIDSENRTVNITPEKGSNPRIFKVSNKLVAMLNTLPKEHEQVFKHYSKLNYMRRSFDRYRKRTAHKLANPRILKITFHTLRHWKASMEYHKTKDILYVMRLLGHKNIKNTLLYTQLVKPNDNEDEYVSKVARTINEARQLVENGFEYVCEIESAKLFRKRK